MSNTGNSELGDPLSRSVEQDDNPSPAQDSSSAMASTKGISEPGRDIVDAEPKTNDTSKQDTIEVNSNGALRSARKLSQSFSRSCSPAEQLAYQTFRSPINDSRGYYANALRRRELGSASPPPSQQRRVGPRLNKFSPPHLPKSMTDASSTRANRASTAPQNGPVQSDLDIEQQSRGRHASPQSPYDSSISGSALHITDGYGGRALGRENFGGDRQRSLPDPYVGVDASMEPFDDGSDIYNDSLGGREQYSFPSQLVPDVYRQDSQDPHSHNAGHPGEENENGVMQGRPRDDWQFYHPAHHPEDSGNRCHMIGYEKRRLPRGYDDTGSDHNRLSQFDAFHRPGQALNNGEDTSLFVSEQDYPSNASTSMKQADTGIGNRGGRPHKQLFSHDTFIKDTPFCASTSAPMVAGRKRKAANDFEESGRFNQPGAVLDPSRYSGDPTINWGLNQEPPSVPQGAVSDAALLKRGLTRGAKEKVCKRGYGANDPENVNIVNMKEDGMSFAEIVEALNETRVANGRAPSLSVCGVTSRYNRTAPLLFAAEGKQFIPLSKRGKGQVLADGPLYEKPVWNDQLDLILAQVVKDVDKDKWNRVAMEYNRRTGKNISAQSAALRHTIL